MAESITVKGTLRDSRHIELAEPVQGIGEEVELVIRRLTPDSGKTLLEILATLPPGSRSKEDIDQQIREERDSWGDR
jgi:hypothetical protein